MAIFKLTGAGKVVVLRAKCITCARNCAAENCGKEGSIVWRDGSQSTCELVRPDDKTGIIAVQLGTELGEEDDAD